MSEERFDRIEAQISELREIMQQNMNSTHQDLTVMQQNMTAMQQNMTAMQQNMTAMQQNMNALREDVVSLRQRVDSIEGATIVAIRDGFESVRNYIDDLNYDLANNERKTRRLARRVTRLEKRDE
jgi:chromosome segregation ATPase